MPNELQALEPASLSQLMEAETEKRKVLNDFISKHLVKDTDYGVIKIAGKDSKPCLFKPGSEKFCSLLQLRAEFSKDEETMSMLPDSKETIVYLCKLVHIPTGNTFSEGRGACSLKEKQGIVNTTIKIAEKRAQIDAVLRLGFSDSFTQDLEDMPEVELHQLHKPNQVAQSDSKQIEPIKIENWQDVVIHFGKNKGKRLGDLDEGYRVWLSGNWTPNPQYNSPSDKALEVALKKMKDMEDEDLNTEENHLYLHSNS